MRIKQAFEKYDFDVSEVRRDHATVVSYKLKSNTRPLTFSFSWLVKDDIMQYLRWNTNKLVSVLLNGAGFTNEVYDLSKLYEFVNKSYVTLSPTEKLDRILEYITAFTVFDGQTINVDGPDEDDAVQMYFTNSEEWWFYF